MTAITAFDQMAHGDSGTVLLELDDWLADWVIPGDALVAANLAVTAAVVTVTNPRLDADSKGILVDYTVSGSATVGATTIAFHWETSQGRKQTRNVPVTIVATI